MERKRKPFIFDTRLGMEGIIAEVHQPQDSKVFEPKRVKVVERRPGIMGTIEQDSREQVINKPNDPTKVRWLA
jgi:hypothetical protein